MVENTQALTLYEELGYEHVRELEVWSLDGGQGHPEECDAEEAHAWIRTTAPNASPGSEPMGRSRRSPSEKRGRIAVVAAGRRRPAGG